MEKLKAQEDKEFREVHKICQQLESKFVDEQKALNRNLQIYNRFTTETFKSTTESCRFQTSR